MFRCRFTSDAQPRTKNGQPPQRTTGAASAKRIQFTQPCGTIDCSGWPGSISDTMNARIGAVITADQRNRRDMSSSSGFRSSTATVRGSSAMPQIGHAPGASRAISGCMGQVHSVFVTGMTSTGSSAIPHFGQAPGPF